MRLTRSSGFLPPAWVCWLALGATSANAAEGLSVKTLSGRPDMVTGGNALIEISGPATESVSVNLNGQDVSGSFHPGREPASLIGRLEGLKLGGNTLEVKAGSQRTRLELVNYQLAGPVFSGPHQAPFLCQTERAGLGAPLDADCTAGTRVDYYYKSTDPPPVEDGASARRAIPREFKVFDPSAPRPADLARTTTTTGNTVDYIVRRETGTINRAIYQIAFLHEPGRSPPDPWTASVSWNGRLVYRFGGGCRAGYRQGRVSSALDPASLSNGYAVAASSLNVFGNNCDDVISAETLMMVKEHFIESFGVPIHTIGAGGSGGSMQQHLIAQNYPGLLDGITPTASYPDIVTLVPPVTDCSLLAHAFEKSEHPWSGDQKTAVSGFATWRTCESWMKVNFSPGWLQPGSCDAVIPKDQVYDAEASPDGGRCGLHDNQVNVYGRDPRSGFARRTLDNVGVQYGLRAFNAGRISAEQFLELNKTIGGYDADGSIVSTRSVADPTALQIAYRTGRVNSGGGSLNEIPIIDGRRYLDPDGNIHDRVRSFALGARLRDANGRSDNRVILTNYEADVNLVRLIDEWLDNIEKDDSSTSVREKIARNKPVELADACWTPGGEKVTEPASFDGPARCNELYPAHGDPRIAGGAPLANDVLKCELKPLDPRDYQKPLTEGQLARLRGIFPGGVCDYSRPGVEQRTIEQTWLRY